MKKLTIAIALMLGDDDVLKSIELLSKPIWDVYYSIDSPHYDEILYP